MQHKKDGIQLEISLAVAKYIAQACPFTSGIKFNLDEFLFQLRNTTEFLETPEKGLSVRGVYFNIS